MPITKIKKRDGNIVDFSRQKIIDAIFKAAQSVGGKDKSRAEQLANHVLQALDKKVQANGGNYVPSVEDVQDIAEVVLIEQGHATTAKAFIIYRQKRREQREAKSAIIGGKIDSTEIDMNGLKLLEKRYLQKDQTGKVLETPTQMFMRVAKSIAAADKKFNKTPDQVKQTQEQFHQMMENLEFLPSSPFLMNAGAKRQQLYSCFVIGVEDSIDSIFDAIKQAALIHHTGGGTGFTFSKLRPKGDSINSSTGTSTGPLSFMRVFDAATNHIKQGGKRRGANMGIMKVDHPDILEFINVKADGKTMSNFNLSVGLSNRFMRAVKSDWDLELINPRTQEPSKKVSSKSIFDSIATMAWKRGDPGVIFVDRLDEKNPTPQLGKIESTSPCAEQPLLPFEGCVLGSLNLLKFITMVPSEKVYDKVEDRIDWMRLKKVVHTAVHFLDNAIEVNHFTSPKLKEATLQTRKIGLGVMGFADLLYELEVPYNSDEAVSLGEKIIKFIQAEARAASSKLANIRGTFPAWAESMYAKPPEGKEKIKLRNAALTCVSPTGSISIIAGVSSSLEPNFALCYQTKVLGSEMIKVNKVLGKKLKEEKLYNPLLITEIAKKGLKHVEAPRKLKKIFVTTNQISPEYHIKMQSAFQKHVDGAVSKTINFPSDCSVEDVKQAYLKAWELGCKGITIYRDNSLDNQVIEKIN